MGYFVHESSYIDRDVSIGERTKIWHFCHVQNGAVIGSDCSLGQNVHVADGVKIGNFCKIQNNVSIYKAVTLEDYVFCGPSCVFTNDINPRSKYPKGAEHYRPTLLKKGASIGANATILCGHVIGRWAMVGAGALVTTDVLDHALVLGIPARRRGWVCECGAVLPEDLSCGRCARRYEVKETGLVESSVSVKGLSEC